MEPGAVQDLVGRLLLHPLPSAEGVGGSETATTSHLQAAQAPKNASVPVVVVSEQWHDARDNITAANADDDETS